MSSFPNSIRQFSTKRDGVDVNYASHINDLQDEVVGIENTLGVLPNIDSRLGASGNFPTVKARLDAMSAGKHMPAFVAGPAYPFRVPPDGNWHTLPLLTPTSSQDPDGLWNGNGFTMNSSGIWVMIYYTSWLSNSASGSKTVSVLRDGYVSQIYSGGAQEQYVPDIENDFWDELFGNQPYISQPFTANHVECEYIRAGETFSLSVRNQTKSTQTVQYFSMGGFQVRGV
jgi:hypothetical protein